MIAFIDALFDGLIHILSLATFETAGRKIARFAWRFGFRISPEELSKDTVTILGFCVVPLVLVLIFVAACLFMAMSRSQG